MSNITTIFNTLKTSVSTLLPNHKQLTNPYDETQNTELTLRQGYGIKIQSGNNTNRVVGCKMSIERTFSVVITRKFYAQELNVSAKETTEKQLLEDQYLLIKEVENNPTLDTQAITKIAYDSDGGIEFIFTERDNFLKLETAFVVEYFESLT